MFEKQIVNMYKGMMYKRCDDTETVFYFSPADFPGGKPLPNRVNVVLTRTAQEIPGFTVCKSPEEAVELAKRSDVAVLVLGVAARNQIDCHKYQISHL